MVPPLLVSVAKCLTILTCALSIMSGCRGDTGPENECSVVVAQWLGAQIQTEERRAFLGRFAQTPRADKGAVLAREAAQT